MEKEFNLKKERMRLLKQMFHRVLTPEQIMFRVELIEKGFIERLKEIGRGTANISNINDEEILVIKTKDLDKLSGD